MTVPRLRVQGLKKHFALRQPPFGRDRLVVYAVDGVSFDISAGETMALVGESGCGKTTVARTIVGIQSPTEGQILFDGADISNPAELRRRRRSVQLISQNPLSSLNRRRSILHALIQPIEVHHLAETWAERLAIVGDLIRHVGLSPSYLQRYPSGMSVGELQRVTIARALAVQPSLLILDEPTASLDVSVKAKLINLLSDLQHSLGLTYLWITHEIDIARHVSDRIAVMYLGKIVELGPTEAVITHPRHPYTQSLLASVPIADPARRSGFKPLAGEVPSAILRPLGCAFHPRCPIAVNSCTVYVPDLRLLAPDHRAACSLAEPAVELPPVVSSDKN